MVVVSQLLEFRLESQSRSSSASALCRPIGGTGFGQADQAAATNRPTNQSLLPATRHIGAKLIGVTAALKNRNS